MPDRAKVVSVWLLVGTSTSGRLVVRVTFGEPVSVGKGGADVTCGLGASSQGLGPGRGVGLKSLLHWGKKVSILT